MNPNREKTISIVQSHGCSTSNLIAILQDIQAACSYLSEESLTVVAEMLGVSVSSVYSVATFYENFSLEPKGRHIIKVCAGTACHVRKSGPIYDAIHEYLGLNDKRKTSSDGMFVMTVDGEVYPKMAPDAAIALLEEIRAKEGQSA